MQLTYLALNQTNNYLIYHNHYYYPAIIGDPVHDRFIPSPFPTASQLQNARHAPTVRVLRDGDLSGRPGGYDRNSTSHVASGLWGMVRLRNLAKPTVWNTWFWYQTPLRWGHEGIFVGWISMNFHEYSLIISTLKEPKILRNRSFQNRLSPYRRNTDRLEGQFHLNTQNPLDFI